MSDSNISSGSSERRPKRCTAKLSDDNVLGISWKEERELRKAMYVSLRQQRTQQDCGARTLRPRFVASTRNLGLSHTNPSLSTRYGRLHWRHRRRVTNDRVIPKHSPRSSRLREVDSFSSTRKSSGDCDANSSEVKKLSAGDRRLHVRKSGLSQRKNTKFKNFTRPQSRRRQPLLQARAFNHQPIDQFYNVGTSNLADFASNKRPTLISASNDEKRSAAISQPTSPQSSPNSVRLRSPVKFAPVLSKSQANSAKLLVVDSDPNISSSRSPFKLPVNPSKKNRPCGTTDRPFQRCLFADNVTTSKSSNRVSDQIVPAELCQDPMGHPVSVHDFVDFVCYRGTPYLDARLQWFNLPHSLRSTVTADQLSSLSRITKSGSLANLSRDTEEMRIAGNSPKAGPTLSPNPVVRITTRSSQKSTAICIAKKLASADRLPSPLPMRVGSSCGR